jgi:imidazolonepropionase-like amidohydrolase
MTSRLRLTSASVFDGGRHLPGRWTVAVAEGLIRDPTEGPVAAAFDGRSIDLAGRSVMPGLIDAQFHPASPSLDVTRMDAMPASYLALDARAHLEAALSRGFTTVRDAGEALCAATRTNARLIGYEGRPGTVAGGAIADLLVIDGDRLEDITLFKRPATSPYFVLRDGRAVIDRLGSGKTYPFGWGCRASFKSAHSSEPLTTLRRGSMFSRQPRISRRAYTTHSRGPSRAEETIA